MGRPDREPCPRCGAKTVSFREDDGGERAICPRCESDDLASIFGRAQEPGERGPGRPRKPKAS